MGTARTPRRLHAFTPNPPAQKGSYSLYAKGRAVGLAKGIGGGYFFSRDGGFAWTGHEIEAEQWAMASCLRDRNNQVLHSGDTVIFKEGQGSTRRIVVVDDTQETWLYEQRGRRLSPVDPHQGRSLWSKLVHVPRQTPFGQSSREEIDHALRTMHLARGYTGQDLVLFALAVIGSACVTGFATWKIQGAVGLLLPFAAAFLASWALHRWHFLQKESLLSRSAMLGLGHRVALISGSVLALVFAAMSFQVWMRQGGGFLAAIGLWVGAVAACGICSILAGDLATWQCGGYPGEGSSMRGRGASR